MIQQKIITPPAFGLALNLESYLLQKYLEFHYNVTSIPLLTVPTTLYLSGGISLTK
jgi:hypothetical protein